MNVSAFSMIFLLPILLLSGVGCTPLLESKEEFGSGEFSDPKRWIARSKARRQTGDLQGALRDLRIANLLAPENLGIRPALELLAARIDSQVKHNLKRGRAAMRAGRTTTARKALLRVLVLQPGQSDALQALRQLDRQVAEQMIARKVRQSRGAHEGEVYARLGRSQEQLVLARAATSTPKVRREREPSPAAVRRGLLRRLEQDSQDREACRLLVQLEMEQAEHAFTKELFEQALRSLDRGMVLAVGDRGLEQSIHAARSTYGKSLYRMGLRSYRSNLDLALNYWRYVLRFDPENEKARLRLKRAQTR